MLRRAFVFDTAMPRFAAFSLLLITFLVPRLSLAQSKVSGGDNFTLVVTADGHVWSFGTNFAGQLGLGHTTDAKSPTQVPNLSGIVAVAAGGQHSLALTSSGVLYGWGRNGSGQVGDQTNIDRSTPQVINLAGVVAIAAGRVHSLALTDTGDLYAWGENDMGQLGTGNTSDSNLPVLVLSGVSAIGAGDRHSLAVKTNGSAWAWGKNAGGQLGNNATASGATTTPVQMIGVTNAVAVYGGSDHSVIRLTDGTLKATGQNGDGQLGDGTTAAERLTPVAVVGLTNVASVAVGYFHNLALDEDGALWSWGDGSKGAVGTGNQSDVNPPVELPSLTDISFIGAGWEHSIAIDENGIVSSWGTNSAGELGDGTTVSRSAPEAISSSGYSWRVATPTFSIAAGTYNTEKSVVVAVDTAGATIHYTLDGAEPTEAHSTISSGSSVTIDQSRTLKAKAWKTGMPTSAIKSAAYTLQAVMPTLTIPPGGPFSSTQVVSMSTATSASTIRYTLDGTNPTSSSPAYNPTTQLPLDQTATIKSATFKNGWSASGVETGTITFNYGALDAPAIAPATGSYAGTVNVTMSSTQSGATIRYTTNGSTPLASSTAYTSAIPISQTTTIKAKAFHSSFTTSGETARTFTMAAATPTLSTAAGSYAPGTTVTIATTEPTATLRMTIDGTDPTSTSPIVLSGTSLILGNFTLKVKAFRSNVGDSAIASAAYTLTSALGPGAVTTGGSHNVLATPDGRLFVWGNNGNGQLGNESTTDRQTPTVINTITGVTAVAGGLAHTLALRADGQLYSWGSNGSGRLGNNSTAQSTRPVHVSTLSNVIAIAAGDAHSLALTSDGRVFSWGSNATGQLGLGNSGSATDQDEPVQIPTLTNIVAIAAGDSQSFAVTSGGQVLAWGANGNSRLGDGTTAQQDTPVLLGLSNIASIAAGQAHTLALTSGGRVFGWGANTNGQLGITPAATVATPTLIPNLHASAIAAGDNQSGAIRADGALLMWGSSSSGQVGSGSITATISTPAVVSGVAASTVSLGDLHSVAVTAAGETFTWGESADYRLGNSNSSQDKSSPQSILTGLASWAAPPPTINVASGSLTAATMVTLTSSVSGAVIRYTQNGSLPTESDPEVPPNGQIEISYASLLRARAFVTGRQPGVAPARADYEMQSAAPMISPGTGTYTAAQSVSITPTGAPGEIRYTLDGSEPSSSSLLYSSPVGVATGTTIKAKTFPSNGWAASSSASATLSFNYGTLTTPTASPGAGVFGGIQSIVLSAISGVIIRYTLDGSDPSLSSSLYTSALSVNTGTVTVKARAFHNDWIESAVLSATYTIDTTAPTISATPIPAPVGGWNNSDVTVNFNCQDVVGISTCSSPITKTAETAGDVVSGAAVDLAGNSTSTNLTVKIDRLPPTVSISAPSSNQVVTTSSLSVTAMVSDSFSGVDRVTCNGVSATVVAGTVSCSVPLSPGRNDVVVHASDFAGNTFSRSVRVTRVGATTQLTLSPAGRTLLVSESQFLALRDNFNAPVVGATWVTSDPAVVEISGDDPPTLTAIAPGTATITASKNGLEAEATLTVVAGVNLPDGTVRWTLNPTPVPGRATWTVLYPNRVDSSVPAMFAVEVNDTSWTTTTIRALSPQGEVEWSMESDGLPKMTDQFGAVLVGTGAGFQQGIARIGGPADAPAWRYESVGRIKAMAQAEDGTIYAVEDRDTGRTYPNGDPITELQLIAIDGATGIVDMRHPLPSEVISGCEVATAGQIPEFAGPIIGIDGKAYLALRQFTRTKCGTPRVINKGISLMRFSNNGLENTEIVWSQQCSISTTVNGACDYPPVIGQVTPDLLGGTVVIWRIQDPAETRLTRYDENSVKSERIVATNTRILLMNEDGVAYVSSSNGYGAMDLVPWQEKWPLSGWPMTARDGGGVVTYDGTNLEFVDPLGNVESATGIVTDALSSSIIQGELISLEQDNSFVGQPIRAIVAPTTVESKLSFQSTGGPTGQLQPYASCAFPPFLNAEETGTHPRSVAPGAQLTYRFGESFPDSIEKQQVIAAFHIWNVAMEASHGTKFDYRPNLADADVVVRRGVLTDTNAVARVENWDWNQNTGAINGAVIAFNTNPVFAITDPRVYHKVALHEIGHLMGLGDIYPGVAPNGNPRVGKKSIMNQGGGRNDRQEFMSWTITSCDLDRAVAAAIRPWP